jgi:hypothetical protein
VVVVPEADEELVMADDSRDGVATCLMATLRGSPGAELLRRSASFTSSVATASSFSRLDFSETRRPWNSSASTSRPQFRSDM